MVLSLGQVFLDTTVLSEPLPLYIGFPVIALFSPIITIVVSLMTAPTEIDTLKNFYRKVQPAGFWKPAKEAVLAEDPGFKKQSPFSRDAAQYADRTCRNHGALRFDALSHSASPHGRLRACLARLPSVSLFFTSPGTRIFRLRVRSRITMKPMRISLPALPHRRPHEIRRKSSSR